MRWMLDPARGLMIHGTGFQPKATRPAQHACWRLHHGRIVMGLYHPYENVLSQVIIVLVAAAEPTFLVGVCKLSQSVTQVLPFIERH